MRLIDLIRATGVYAPCWSGPVADPLGLSLYFPPDLPVFNIDNVAEYLYGETDQEVWQDEDFPNMAPPFKNFFMEYRRPTRIVSCDPKSVGGVDPLGMSLLTGTLFQTVQRPEGGWAMVGLVFCTFDGAHAIGPSVITAFTVEPDGKAQAHRVSTAVSTPEGIRCALRERPYTAIAHGLTPDAVSMFRQTMEQVTRDPKQLEAVVHVVIKEISTWTFPMRLALSFLHCKNVTVRDEPASTTRAERRRGITGGTTMKVLDIKPMQRVLREAGNSEQNGLQRALHIVRGHFKSYSAERPLFGKHVGDYWWHDRVAGSEDAGTVKKTYRVLTRSGVK